MKKIVALVAFAAIAGGMIFAQPVFEPSVTLDGSATAKWGVDLDAGQTGFSNETSGDFKVKLWGDGSRELEAGDGIWAELKVTGKELKFDGKKEGAARWDGGAWELNEAKIHINDFYVGIKSGDTQVGEYKFDGAIRSADNDNAKWLTNVGPEDFSQGITLGYGNDNLGVDVDLRSYYYDGDKKTKTETKYTSAYAIALEAQLKDSNEWVEGLAVKAGLGYNISDNYKFTKKETDGELFDAYFDAPSDPTEKAAEAEKTDVEKAQEAFDENPSAETLKALKEAKDAAEIKAASDAVAAAAASRAGKAKRDDQIKGHVLGYAFSGSYKFAIDDTYYVKPALGLTGSVLSAKGKDFSATGINNYLVAGALFGWGERADSDAGVYFLNDGDQTKKVTPGISVVAAIPFASTYSKTSNGTTSKATINDSLIALIVPSVYLGSDLVEGLKFAAYSEMGILRWVDEADQFKPSGNDVTINNVAADKDRTFALAFAMGVAYDLKMDDITITPKAGLRYANTAYFENAINENAPLSTHPLFEAGYDKMGVAQDPKDKKGDNQNYFNLKIGVDVAGLIDNTTFFAEYASANLMNDNKYEAKNEYDENIKHYNIKLGTFNVGAKISF